MKIDKKAEWHRLRREIGLMLKQGRRKEMLSPQEIANQLGLPGPKIIYDLENGRSNRLETMLKLIGFYGLRLHVFMDYDDTENIQWRQKQAEYSIDYFKTLCGGRLAHQRRYHHYSLDKLARLSGIDAAKIKAIEEGEAEFDLSETCLLLAFFNKGIAPEVLGLD